MIGIIIWAYRSLFVSGENNKERESITTGRIMSYETYYNTSKSTSKTVLSNTAGNGIGIDTGLYVDDGNAADNTKLPTYLSAQKTPVFQISMSDFIPIPQNESNSIYICYVIHYLLNYHLLVLLLKRDYLLIIMKLVVRHIMLTSIKSIC